MSVFSQTIYCTKCDYELPFDNSGNFFRYELENGNRIFAPICPGYCAACNEILMIHSGLSVNILKEEIRNLEEQIEYLKNKKFLFHLPKSVKNEIESAQLMVNEKQNYLSLLNDQDSCYNCLMCGSTDVVPLMIYSEKFLQLDGSLFLHEHCGGELKLRTENFRLHVSSDDILIRPTFKNLVQKPISFVAKSKSNLYTGEKFKLIFEVNHTFDEFESPVFDDFKVISGPLRETKQKLSDGITDSVQIIITYYLEAFKSGDFHLIPAKISIDKKIYESNSLSISVTKHQQTKQLTSNDVPNFDNISNKIIQLIEYEKYIIKTKNNELLGFTCESIYDATLKRRFMIERFLFISAYFGLKKFSFDLELMKKFVVAISSQVYKISTLDATRFINDRIDFYIKELNMFYTMEYPHPGKMFWCLYHPDCKRISHELDSDFEDNFFAGLYLIKMITIYIDGEIIKGKEGNIN